MRKPLGIAIVGGLIFSQVLTLYTTPVVYLYLDRLRLWGPAPPGPPPRREADARRPMFREPDSPSERGCMLAACSGSSCPIALGVALAAPRLRVGAGGCRLRADPRLDAGGLGVDEPGAAGHAAARPPAPSGRRATYADFVLRFELPARRRLERAPSCCSGPAAHRTAPLDRGYRVALGGADVGPAPPRPAQGRRHETRAGTYTGLGTPSANGGWVACEVRAERETLTRQPRRSGGDAIADRAGCVLRVRGLRGDRHGRASSCAACGSRRAAHPCVDGHARTASRRRARASRSPRPRTRTSADLPAIALRSERRQRHGPARVRDRGRRPARRPSASSSRRTRDLAIAAAIACARASGASRQP